MLYADMKCTALLREPKLSTYNGAFSEAIVPRKQLRSVLKGAPSLPAVRFSRYIRWFFKFS